MHHVLHSSPIGTLTLIASATALVAVRFEDERRDRTKRPASIAAETPLLAEARRQFDAYFTGARRSFDLPLAPAGTPFQQRVWAELARIPFGETRSYLAVAEALKQPTATRAVGMANGRNPLPIVVPCHRVIGADGSLTGFGGGLPIKRWLLAHEGVALADTNPPQLSFALA